MHSDIHLSESRFAAVAQRGRGALVTSYQRSCYEMLCQTLYVYLLEQLLRLHTNEAVMHVPVEMEIDICLAHRTDIFASEELRCQL